MPTDPRPFDDLADLRHDLHRHPELGLDLPRTQGRVLEALSALDLEVATGTACSSVTAVLRGNGAAGPDDQRPTVLLRGDMDALPVHEDVASPFRSIVAGHMHACGHDQHMAMVVGAARLLHDRRDDLRGDVVFMFQPGEEGYNGAEVMIDEGVLDAAGRRADAAWALHVMSGREPRGMVAARPGAMLAASNELWVTVRGRGGHGSAPERARDPIPTAAEMVTGLQVVLSRVTSPFDPVVLTVGQFHAGSQPNIISDQARFGATVRCLDPDVLDVIEHEVVQYCHGVAAANGVEADVTFDRKYPVTINDPAAIGQAQQVVGRVLGPDRWHTMPHPSSGSEDFSRVLEAVPGAMLFLGACTRDDHRTAPDNHSSLATFDDRVLADGATLLAELAEASIDRLTA